ncbi:MAG: PLDc_N domain-containing protein [Anaerolineales bacterium]|nr:MAG: PLDc_N domain-containing protein [Anaerolineales bacterium]
MDQIRAYLPLLIPLFLIQLALMIFALLDIARREKLRGPKWVWVVVVIFINIIGPLVYFVLGREEE